MLHLKIYQIKNKKLMPRNSRIKKFTLIHISNFYKTLISGNPLIWRNIGLKWVTFTSAEDKIQQKPINIL